ncbi:uncharacterized protein [Macrobrachium rosenbergii]|uniref:uncharacterized protein isoform X2 n=1 Tax=Macrobrachium rosenbergii TaxID=79674 RepID=UPI0034D44BCA
MNHQKEISYSTPMRMAVQYVDISDPDNHPMIKAAEESTVTCPTNIDPNAYWMKRFLKLIKDRMPHQAVTWNELLPNLRHLVDLETKGYLAAIAKGDFKADDITWPNEALKPWIIPTFMPVVTPPDPEPVIVVEQVYNGERIYKEIIGNQIRKKRDLSGGEVDEVEALPQRAFHVNPNHFNDDLPYLGRSLITTSTNLNLARMAKSSGGRRGILHQTW